VGVVDLTLASVAIIEDKFTSVAIVIAQLPSALLLLPLPDFQYTQINTS